MIKQEDTISTISTAFGEGGIGIVRMSGKDAVAIADRVFLPYKGKRISKIGSYRAVYGQILDREGMLLDEAIALVMRSPHSYTREDVVELQCHGGMAALRAVLARTLEEGARPAERGEFTKRAFLNGRLDLSQAQSVMDIVQARTGAALRAAAGRLSGRASGRVKGIRGRLLESIAHLEAVIDFPEEGLAEVSQKEIEEKVVDLVNELRDILQGAQTGRILREGLATAIIGKPNVGKSSLLNLLLGEDRAIVTELPGTTRDSIEAYADVGGIPLRLIDTAGIRATEDRVERIGVERAREQAEKADLLLAVLDGSQELSDLDGEILSLLEGRRAILLANKCDLPQKLDLGSLSARFPGIAAIPFSARTGEGLEALRQAICSLAYAAPLPEGETPLLRDEREEHILRRAAGFLDSALHALATGLGEDFVSIDLRSAWEVLGEFTGEQVGEDILNEIFSKFCIGK